MSIWWSLQLRREAASVPLARRLLLGAMEAQGVDAEVSHELSVALSEACSNAVRHGGGGPCEVYRVTAFIDDELCRIEVADGGLGFPGGPPVVGGSGQGNGNAQGDGRSDGRGDGDADGLEGEVRELAVGGRGLHLIEALSDRVRFGSEPGGGGAVVTFDRALRRAEGALLRAS
ncbi:ATP-binding protein [Streptomyces sp. 6N223]|uniref:ATP-binding protein n=1 Tax=Streptomyces sp. 6N223 TaxID=3457412 RepID=UPI003FD0E52C